MGIPKISVEFNGYTIIERGRTVYLVYLVYLTPFNNTGYTEYTEYTAKTRTIQKTVIWGRF